MNYLELAKVGGPVIGAFLAAWAGAQLGFRKSKKERALDRRIAWHEETIQALAQYEEQIERLRKMVLNTLIVQPTALPDGSRDSLAPGPSDLPRKVRAPQEAWTELSVAEGRARAALRLGDLYTEGRASLSCSTALSTSVNLVIGNWADVRPEPEIEWAGLPSRALSVAGTRRMLQESLRVILELDGFVAAVLGERYRRRRLIKQLEKLQAELSRAS